MHLHSPCLCWGCSACAGGFRGVNEPVRAPRCLVEAADAGPCHGLHIVLAGGWRNAARVYTVP